MSLIGNLAENLHRLRKTQQMTLEEFSEKLEISKTALQQLEAGTGNPTLKTLEHIAERVDSSPAALLSLPTGEQLVYAQILEIMRQFPAIPTERQVVAAVLFYYALHIILEGELMEPMEF